MNKSMPSRGPLLSILCALASLLVLGIASASAVSSGENRVWAFGLQDHVHVAGQHALTLELHPSYELEEYNFASGSPLAAKGGAKATKGLQKQLDKHLKKLEDYKANPDKFDNKGFLKGASPERRQKIIESRIQKLERQIGNFRNQINQGGGG